MTLDQAETNLHRALASFGADSEITRNARAEYQAIRDSKNQINKGDRVRSKDGKKSGTAIRDEHASPGGPAVYIRWDNAKRPACPVSCKNLRVIN
jgi:hypothetical protein